MRELEAERARLEAAVRTNPADPDLYRTLHEREIDLKQAEEQWLATQE